MKDHRRFWFTSDWHLGHADVLKFEPGRAKVLQCSSIEEHDAALVERYNKIVKPHDIVYVLGDVGFTDVKSVTGHVMQLNGSKHLILGNHDRLSAEQYRRMGFMSVLTEAVIKLGGMRLRLSHYPYRENWLRETARFLSGGHILRDRHKRPMNDGKWILHGHVHSRAVTIPYHKQIHIGVDTSNYQPVSWEQVLDIITKHNKE